MLPVYISPQRGRRATNPPAASAERGRPTSERAGWFRSGIRFSRHPVALALVVAATGGADSHGDDDLAGGVTPGEVTDRVGRVGEGIGAVDDRRDGAGLDEPGHGIEVLGALLGDQPA